MSTLIEHETSVEKEVTVTDTVSLYVRPSKKNPDTLVIGAAFNGTRKRIALVRVTEDGAKVRTLDGNPREASSRAVTQTVLDLPFDALSDDD